MAKLRAKRPVSARVETLGLSLLLPVPNCRAHSLFAKPSEAWSRYVPLTDVDVPFILNALLCFPKSTPTGEGKGRPTLAVTLTFAFRLGNQVDP